MASINVINIDVLNPQSTFLTGFDFEITFECVAPVTDGVCWNAERNSFIVVLSKLLLQRNTSFSPSRYLSFPARFGVESNLRGFSEQPGSRPGIRQCFGWARSSGH